MKKSIFSAGIFIFIITTLAVMGCSGGGSSSSSGTVSSLQVGERVSVVDSQDSGSGRVMAMKIGIASVADLPATSAYNTDESFTYVEERSAESFNIINEILCMMGQAQYDDMLNQGNYKAQIDINQCSTSKDSASSSGESSQNQSSGANSTEYAFWTVNSSRASNADPQIVKAWIHEKAQDMGGGFSEPAKTIHTKTVITESVSSTNPYGIFTMNFSALSDDDGSEMFSGYLKSERQEDGTILLKFYCNGAFGPQGSQMTFTEKVTLNRASDGSAGSGSIYNAESNPFEGDSTENYNIAYNSSYFYRSDGTDNVCMNRTNTNSSTWRYGLYYDENHATPGERVAVNSGFPVKYTDDGGNDYFGWAGYYGLWFPDSVSLSSGDTVYKQTFSSSGTTETPYNIFIAGGKLIKHTKKSITLGDITDVPLSWNECTEGESGWTCVDTRVVWNGTNLVKNAVRSEATNYVWQDITEAALTFGQNDWDFNFWSESLGGSGRINLRDPESGSLATLTDSTAVVFHVEDTVYPGDSGIPTSLACFEDCPEPDNINGASPYFSASTWQSQSNFSNTNMNVAPGDLEAGTNYIAYTFDTSSMLLAYGGAAAVKTGSDNNQYGVWTGPMFEPTTDNFSALACDWDSSQTCTWKAWNNLDVFYTWETGTQQWNKLTALQSGDTFVSFDPPVSVEYTHTNGTKFFLEYNGFGDLHGIPGKCVDMDTGQDTACYDESGSKFIRWVPNFDIADGSTVTDAVTGDTYYVKGLEKEERMSAESDATPCTNAGLSLTSYTLPDSSLYEAPGIGDEPVVTDAPAVIGGVLQ